MKQNDRGAPRRGRRLSESQRQRLLRERKRRSLRRKLYALLAVLGILLVVLVFALLGTWERDVPAEPALAMATPVPTDTPAPTQSPTPTPEPATPTPQPTAAATVPPAVDERAESMLSTPYDPSAPFSYESAYVAAVQGVDTGAPVEPDLSGVDPSKRDRWPAADAGFLPMVAHANTNENIIAVTVDDCNQAENLRDIVNCALQNGARLTIFPIGQNLERESIASTVRWAWQQGMEIENHTYSHAGTYHYDDDAMTDDIWRQSYLLNQALGVNYRQHFFRPKGGDERFDQRTHAYARQLGFAAIALWTQSGSVDSVESALNNLGPGRIYLFHTTDKDRTKLLQFIPEATRRGYRLVTLNDMFGLRDNETAELSTAATEKPALQSFRVIPMTLKLTSYARAAAVVQKRLIELGWMTGEPTGVYGKTTHACIELFQLAAGLSADGTAGAETQRLLFSETAPVGSMNRIRELGQQLDASAQDALREMLEG